MRHMLMIRPLHGLGWGLPKGQHYLLGLAWFSGLPSGHSFWNCAELDGLGHFELYRWQIGMVLTYKSEHR